MDALAEFIACDLKPVSMVGTRDAHADQRYHKDAVLACIAFIEW